MLIDLYLGYLIPMWNGAKGRFLIIRAKTIQKKRQNLHIKMCQLAINIHIGANQLYLKMSMTLNWQTISK